MSTQVNKPESTSTDEALRAIAYSMDALIPGFYFWWGMIKICIGGSPAEPSYPGTLHRSIGIALVLPGYQIYTSYHDTYDPR